MENDPIFFSIHLHSTASVPRWLVSFTIRTRYT